MYHMDFYTCFSKYLQLLQVTCHLRTQPASIPLSLVKIPKYRTGESIWKQATVAYSTQVPVSHVLCSQIYKKLHRQLLMLTCENVSFSSVRKPLLGWKHRISAALCYPQDLLTHGRQSIDNSEIIWFLILLCFFVGWCAISASSRYLQQAWFFLHFSLNYFQRLKFLSFSSAHLKKDLGLL